MRPRAGDYRACRAVSYLVEPRCDNLVLCTRLDDGRGYILAVLERTAHAELRVALDASTTVSVRDGELQLRARNGIRLVSDGAIGVVWVVDPSAGGRRHMAGQVAVAARRARAYRCQPRPLGREPGRRHARSRAAARAICAALNAPLAALPGVTPLEAYCCGAPWSPVRHMTAMIVDPAEAATPFREQIRAQLTAMREPLVLVGVLASDHGPSHTYAQYAQRACTDLGIAFQLHHTPRLGAEAAIRRVNDDPSVHGLMVYYPIFGTEQDVYLRDVVAPSKDIEGLHPIWSRLLYEIGASWMPGKPRKRMPTRARRSRS